MSSLLDFGGGEQKQRMGSFTTGVSAVHRSLQHIQKQSPQYGAKLNTLLARMDERFFDRAERFLTTFERFLLSKGKTFEYGIDCFMTLRDEMVRERIEFLRTGRYSSCSFAEVEQRVYSNPRIMEYRMYGLVFGQFFWPEQYARLDFFCDQLLRYRDRIGSYLELGGGHAMYIASAIDVLPAETYFELVDISPVSLELAQAMTPHSPIRFHQGNVLEFPDNKKYDLVVAGEVIEHLEDPRTLLARIRRMLAPDGRAFISTPTNSATVDHIYLFRNANEIRDLLASEGFVIETETTRYAEDMPAAQAEKLQVAQMFAAIVRDCRS